MSERENVVTIVRKATRIQQQAIEETKKEISYSQLVRVGKLIAEASCVDFYVYDMNVYLAEYGRSLFFMEEKWPMYFLRRIFRVFRHLCLRMDILQF